jgi:hypothetical protein
VEKGKDEGTRKRAKEVARTADKKACQTQTFYYQHYVYIKLTWA